MLGDRGIFWDLGPCFLGDTEMYQLYCKKLCYFVDKAEEELYHFWEAQVTYLVPVQAVTKKVIPIIRIC